MQPKTLKEALEDAANHLKVLGNDKVLLTFNPKTKDFGRSIISTPEQICEFFNTPDLRPICLLNHQACLSIIDHSLLPDFEAKLAEFAMGESPPPVQVTLLQLMNGLCPPASPAEN